jgi:hypothetical protein
MPEVSPGRIAPDPTPASRHAPRRLAAALLALALPGLPGTALAQPAATLTAAAACRSTNPTPLTAEARAEGDAPALLAYYQGVYDREYARHGADFERMAAQGNGEERNYYTLEYVLMGALSLYEASGDERYLRQALRGSMAEIAHCTVIDSHGDCNWSGTWRPTTFATPAPIALPLDDAQGMTQLARLARLILTRPALSAYRAQGVAVYRFVKAQWLDKWLNHRHAWPWFRDDMKSEAHAIDDKTVMLGEIMAHMTRAAEAQPSEARAARRFAALARRLARGLLDHEGGRPRFTPLGSGLGIDIGRTWADDDGGCGARSIDTAHANRYPAAMVAFHETGLAFDRALLRDLAAGFAETVWNQSFAAPAFSNYVDGDNRCFRTRPAYGNGAIYLGWNMLAAYSHEMFDVADATLRQWLAGTRNPSLEYNGSPFGIIALAGGLARAVATGVPEPGYAPRSASSSKASTWRTMASRTGRSSFCSQRGGIAAAP